MLRFDVNNPFVPAQDMACKENLPDPKLLLLIAPHKTKTPELISCFSSNINAHNL